MRSGGPGDWAGFRWWRRGLEHNDRRPRGLLAVWLGSSADMDENEIAENEGRIARGVSGYLRQTDALPPLPKVHLFCRIVGRVTC